MNAKHLIAAVALISPLYAFAQATPPVTRAQVRAELAQARANGTVPLSEASFLTYQLGAPSTVTREQVTAELYRARANGEICGNEAECGAAPVRLRPAPEAGGRNVHICQNEAECDAAPPRDFSVTRAQVLAELYRARAAGEIPETEADNDVGRAALRSRAK
jgi:hypothetical protein